ncbi:hypothetical protein PG997_007070 [Apiospora hydei]|uniref:Uncharacterized protein n=1 Tax=Apiospora hydei TaxID=1337664 RepID=A0ABR1WQI8_9PEZI
MAISQAGGEDRVCHECKAITESYSTIASGGVRDGTGGERPDSPVFSTTLAEATSKSRSCWHCGWIVLLTTCTWPNDIVGQLMSSTGPGGTTGKVMIKWESISNESSHLHGRGRGPPSVERLVMTYHATENWAERKQLRFYKTEGRPQNLASIAAQIPMVAQATSTLDWTPTPSPTRGGSGPRPSTIDC